MIYKHIKTTERQITHKHHLYNITIVLIMIPITLIIVIISIIIKHIIVIAMFTII